MTSMVGLSRPVRYIWAKTGRGDDSHLWMPLYVHMGDSAAIAAYLWRWVSPSTRHYIGQALGVGEQEACELVSLLAGIHDLGKASPNFQSKVPNLCDAVVSSGLKVSKPLHSYSHAYIGACVSEQMLFSRGWGKGATYAFSGVIGAHHGQNPNSADLKSIGFASELYTDSVLGDASWGDVREELMVWLCEHVAPWADGWARQSGAVAGYAQILLTGLVIMADWIASNTSLFPLIGGCAAWETFDARARLAWQKLSLPPHHRFINDVADRDLFHVRFPRIPACANMADVQMVACRVAQTMPEAGIIIVEAPMGCGKTEAALLSAEILARRFGLGGICYLLPTMATSDAMFKRVESWLETMVSPDEISVDDLHLIHGKAALNEDYARLASWGDSWMGDASSSGESIVAHQWFSGNKRGLLAPFVVATVDQLLMAALNTRHVHLRHLGLMDKVVIIDEVHAYDSYMNVYLDRVLAFLGAYHVPVVLLSATLPAERRNSMLLAYQGRDLRSRQRRRDGGVASSQDMCPAAYPLVSMCSSASGSAIEQYVCKSDARSVDVSVSFVSNDRAELARLLNEMLQDGGCACVLRNTVREAQETYASLREQLSGGVEVLLMHARFIAFDRAENDRRLLSMLGPDGANRPHSLVVVATQVVEQSLDIDFDLLVTDIAPIDLVLQRMGRLHRHGRGPNEMQRPALLRKPQCYVISSTEDSQGMPSFDGGTEAVYERSLLLRTYHALKTLDGGMVSLPADIADLVGCVYEHRDDLPDAWASVMAEADSRFEMAVAEKRDRARAWLLTKPSKRKQNLDGWMRDHVDLGDDNRARAAVRDTDDSLEVVLVQKTGQGYEVLPWVAESLGVDPNLGDGLWECADDAARAAALCTVSLPRQLCAPYRIGGVITALDGADCYQGWQSSRWLAGQLILALDESCQATISLESGVFPLRYTREEGLVLI